MAYMNDINWKPKAVKQLLKLPKPAQVAIRGNVNEKLSIFPNCQDVKKLTKHAYSYRLRVDNYRVFFEFDGYVQIIDIEEVKKT